MLLQLLFLIGSSIDLNRRIFRAFSFFSIYKSSYIATANTNTTTNTTTKKNNLWKIQYRVGCYCFY